MVKTIYRTIVFIDDGIYYVGAGWSSLAARRAHNPKVVGSNPAPATTFLNPFLLKSLIKFTFQLFEHFIFLVVTKRL